MRNSNATAYVSALGAVVLAPALSLLFHAGFATAEPAGGGTTPSRPWECEVCEKCKSNGQVPAEVNTARTAECVKACYDCYAKSIKPSSTAKGTQTKAKH